SPVATARLRPLEQIRDAAEAVVHAHLAARAGEQHVRFVERLLAPGAGGEARVVDRLARLPARSADRPRHDVLQAAEGRPPRAFVDAIGVADRVAAPRAAIAHTTPSGSTKRRSPAASSSGSPSRAAMVIGMSGLRVAKSAVATLRPPNACARPSTA